MASGGILFDESEISMERRFVCSHQSSSWQLRGSRSNWVGFYRAKFCAPTAWGLALPCENGWILSIARGYRWPESQNDMPVLEGQSASWPELALGDQEGLERVMRFLYDVGTLTDEAVSGVVSCTCIVRPSWKETEMGIWAGVNSSFAILVSWAWKDGRWVSTSFTHKQLLNLDSELRSICFSGSIVIW